MIAVDLIPRGPFHVGELGIGREETLPYIPSDTLYAAMVTAWVAMGESGLFAPPPLQVTSVFPRVGMLHIYPRPFLRFNLTPERRNALGKTLSKLEWCSETIFGLLLQGADMSALAVKDNFVGGVWFHPDDRLPPAPKSDEKWKRFWETQPPVPHVAIDRVDNAPNLFHSGQVTFGPGCGLWFGVHYNSPVASSRLERAMAYLADAGLGGLRSTGHGGFAYEVNEAPIWERASSAYGVTLSRYIPSSAVEITEALKADRAAYKLIRVGGWCQDNNGHTWRRKQIRMVREGSVLGWNGKPLGRIADLKPEDVGQFGDRPVLRYGLAWMLPVSKEALL